MSVEVMSGPDQHEDSVVLTPEQKRRRARRNVAVALILGGLVLLFFAMTIVRLGGNVADRTF